MTSERTMGALIVSLLLLGQTPGAPLKDIPALQKPITIEKTIMMLPEAMAELKEQTGITFNLADNVKDRKVCILIKDMPAHRIVTHLANLFELKPNFDGTRVWMDEPPKAWSERYHYLQVETKTLYTRAFRQVWALAEATKKPIGVQTGTFYDQAKIDQSDAYLDTWAADMVTRADHHAAGFLVRHQDLPRITLAPFGVDFDKMTFYGEGFNPQYLMGGDFPFTFRVAKGGKPLYRDMDEYAKPIESQSTEVWFEPNSGVFVDATTNGLRTNTYLEKSPPLIRYPKPVGALAALPFGARVLQWERRKPVSDALVDVPVNEQEAGPTPVYSTKGVMTVDHLAWIHQTTGVPIIADSFRIPSAKRTLGRIGATAREALETIVKTDSMFLRYEQDAVLLHHGGYWRLQVSEPPEGYIQKFDEMSESGDILFDEYAIAAANWPKPCMARFIQPNRFLAKFDIAPLQTGYFGLMGAGSLPPALRTRLWSGVKPIWRNLPPWTGPEDITLLFANTTGTVHPTQPKDEYEMAVMMAMFSDGQIIGKFADLMEARKQPVAYLKNLGLWDEYWKPFEMTHPDGSQPDILDYHWRYISLIVTPEPNVRFGLFYSFTPYDGVIYWLRRKGQVYE